MFSALRLCVTVCKVHLAFSPLRYKKLGFFSPDSLKGDLTIPQHSCLQTALTSYQ